MVGPKPSQGRGTNQPATKILLFGRGVTLREADEVANVHGGHNDGMGGSDAPRVEWVVNLPSGPPEKDVLARLVDADGGRDDAENSYYETAADPDFVRFEAARRGFRGRYLRRLRRLAGRNDRASASND